MDVGSRNNRLCETLQGMGLFVLPVFAGDDPNQIDHMLVSVSLPRRIEQGTEDASGAPVATPMTSSEIGMTIKPAKDGGLNVVDFPTVFRKLAVVGEADHLAVAVHPVVGMAGNFDGA
jgi:hypothetical protein